MTSGTVRAAERMRPSGADRERAALVLRRACASERLSVDTFSLRLDQVYAARTCAELDRLVGDVPEPGAVRAAVLRAVAWASGWSSDVRAAWRLPRTPRLVLPTRPDVLLGRSPQADFVVADDTVSARHAVLGYAERRWTLRDLGSRNGTFVNGWRIVDETEVHPGDEVTFGYTSFVLAPPRVP